MLRGREPSSLHFTGDLFLLIFLKAWFLQNQLKVANTTSSRLYFQNEVEIPLVILFRC